MNLYKMKHILRTINRQKIFSFINILGLTLGLTGCLLACLYVQDELKFDKHFKNTTHVYQLKGNNFSGEEDISEGQPGVMLPFLMDKFPEIESGNRIIPREPTIGYRDKIYIEKKFLYTDSNFFRFYGWELVRGNSDNVLKNPFSLVISQKKAKELFGSEDPVGKVVKLDLNHNATITGIFKDIPYQSHITADLICSISSLRDLNPSTLNHWGNFGSYLYVKINPKTNPTVLVKKILDFWNNNTFNQCCGARGTNIRLFLQQFKDIYFTRVTMAGEKPGNILYVIIFSTIAGILLVIALFNFINLSIAQITNRFTEAGVKKVLGAGISDLCKQLFTETTVYVLMAMILSNILLISLLPAFNSFLGKHLVFTLFHNPVLLAFNLTIFVFTLLCTSLYPSLYFAGVKPVTVINASKGGILSKLGKRSYFWDVMVVVQFSLAILLIVSAIVVNKQLHFIHSKDPGFARENVISIETGWPEKRYEVYKEKALKIPGVLMISSGMNVPTDGIWNWGSPTPVNDPDKYILNCGFISVDYDYFRVLKCKILAGRDFDKNAGDEKTKCIISETFKKRLGVKNPVGMVLDNLWDGKKREIIGVVNDIHFNTLHNEMRPEIFFLHHTSLPSYIRTIIRFKTTNVPLLLSKLKSTWTELAPDAPFNYFFIDQKFETNYERETKITIILNILTGVAIFLCCLGLFGLALFVINNRFKEIGIRKTNGATILQVITLVNKPFIQWIALAYIIACPIALLLARAWLQDFAYRTEINTGVFILAGFLTLLIASATVSYHSWKAARTNPIETLRYE